MKKLLVFILLSGFIQSHAQIARFSGGLGFSSGVDYNAAKTGNPAVFGKAYLELSKRFHIVPGLIIYNKGEGGSSLEDNLRRNYMFQADIDGHFGLFREDQITLVGFAGLNMTGIVSRVIGNLTTLENQSTYKPGLNLGLSAELRINNSYDAVVSAKYIASEIQQAVINIGIIYHLGRSRGGIRW